MTRFLLIITALAVLTFLASGIARVVWPEREQMPCGVEDCGGMRR